MVDDSTIAQRFGLIRPFLDERLRRLLAAAEATALGRWGISRVARATGVSRRAITQGQKELRGTVPVVTGRGRQRRPGGGRKAATVKDPGLRRALERLVEPTARGDPESPLRWSCKSVRKLAGELTGAGHAASHDLVSRLLHELGYSLQANEKTHEGGTHPDRDAQFTHISRMVAEFQRGGQPVISVDTKKKELVGNFKNQGREWRRRGDPEQVSVYDFVIPELGRASPYGVLDITRNCGWVSVGVDHDTAAFAVESIRRWWRTMGQSCYPAARELLITADCGGSNGYRVRLWKVELQKFANESGLKIAVCHFPPGTSKWNKIEHRLFSFISQNWRGKPLLSHEVIVNLIGGTTTSTGLTVQCQLDENTYPKGVRVPDQELAAVRIERNPFHGEWNYAIKPISS